MACAGHPPNKKCGWFVSGGGGSRHSGLLLLRRVQRAAARGVGGGRDLNRHEGQWVTAFGVGRQLLRSNANHENRREGGAGQEADLEGEQRRQAVVGSNAVLYNWNARGCGCG
jgi:hypothetical protein